MVHAGIIKMSVRSRIALAGLGSFALLIGALGFQYLGGLAPCPMCIWQRWPHLVAILFAIGAMSPIGPQQPLILGGGLSAAIAAGLGAYHMGVEQRWWEGPSSCVGFDPSQMTPEELFQHLATAPLVRCDEIPWEFLGLSMAGWNALFSAVLVILWLSALGIGVRKRST